MANHEVIIFSDSFGVKVNVYFVDAANIEESMKDLKEKNIVVIYKNYS